MSHTEEANRESKACIQCTADMLPGPGATGPYGTTASLPSSNHSKRRAGREGLRMNQERTQTILEEETFHYYQGREKAGLQRFPYQELQLGRKIFVRH